MLRSCFKFIELSLSINQLKLLGKSKDKHDLNDLDCNMGLSTEFKIPPAMI